MPAHTAGHQAGEGVAVGYLQRPLEYGVGAGDGARLAFARVIGLGTPYHTGKTKSIHAGLEEARSTIEVKGNIYGRMQSSVLQEVYFTVATTTGGDAIDFTDAASANASNLVVISYSDAYQIFPTINWTMTKLNTTDADNMLDKNELFMITVDLTVVSANATPEQMPGPYHTSSWKVW